MRLGAESKEILINRISNQMKPLDKCSNVICYLHWQYKNRIFNTAAGKEQYSARQNSGHCVSPIAAHPFWAIQFEFRVLLLQRVDQSVRHLNNGTPTQKCIKYKQGIDSDCVNYVQYNNMFGWHTTTVTTATFSWYCTDRSNSVWLPTAKHGTTNMRMNKEEVTIVKSL